MELNNAPEKVRSLSTFLSCVNIFRKLIDLHKHLPHHSLSNNKQTLLGAFSHAAPRSLLYERRASSSGLTAGSEKCRVSFKKLNERERDYVFCNLLNRRVTRSISGVRLIHHTMGQEQSSDASVHSEEAPHWDDPARLTKDESSESILEEEEIQFNRLSGYRVMKVFRGSPATRAGLMPFEDFIMAVQGVIVEKDNRVLANVLKENEGKDVALVVWNCIDLTHRNVTLRPVKWSGPGLLGAAVRYEKVDGATECIWHVLDVVPKSPADDAGLVPRTDYIVGTPAEVFRKDADLSRLVCLLQCAKNVHHCCGP